MLWAPLPGFIGIGVCRLLTGVPAWEGRGGFLLLVPGHLTESVPFLWLFVLLKGGQRVSAHLLGARPCQGQGRIWARDQSALNRAGFAGPSQKQAPLPFSNDVVKYQTLCVHLNNLRAITLRVGFASHSTLAQSWHFRSRAQPHALDSADRTGAGFLGTRPPVRFRPMTASRKQWPRR